MADSKWESEETAEVKGITTEQVWSLLADFCNLQNYFPYIAKCTKVEGEEGKPGLVRRSTTSTETREFMADSAGEQQQSVGWSNEKLVMINHDERCLIYEILENSMGVKSYVATFKVVELDGSDDAGCKIHWSFVGDPLEGITLEEYGVQRNFVLQLMVQKIQAYYSVSA